MTDLKKKYHHLFSKSLSKLTKLHGDASNRIYYRAHFSDQSTAIIMQLPEGALSASEEITNFKGKKTEIPFLNIANFLEKNNIPIPKVLHFSPEDKCILLEDLGDITMGSLIANAPAATRKKWYTQAIDLLIQLQSIPIHDPRNCYALMRSFDETLYNWEFDHFFEYGIEKRLNIPIAKEDKKIMLEWSRSISNQLAQLQPVLVHRDFQSRNLMVSQDKLKLIDFQDALLGPSLYDLVALLRDSYIELDNSLLDSLLHYYCDKTSIGHFEAFLTIFDTLTIQRKLKDAGRFVYIDRVKGNDSFLKFIPTSLRYVHTSLKRQKEFYPLYDSLKKYIPEWSEEACSCVR
ncbi:MAG: hypothetical protein A3I75_00770 [Deltaproteobacteria bacterium RIFCSPLOWO2_02_FULL_50_16]|nr:MAG: hypothetical protein A2053_04630 [Deltaproteobacteria bacterium GWA2_50_8]OGQ30518.1 MAG: hypothetical protein A3B79_02560 [Deltaproteobacteria bacterium RIFCSPHIGHO2_02_FULL_50_15]OGQ56360.1 MAG: hypothetical protein A3I75_00770 [Deltaproteobacteria bacterium RIFCSPLOWO2_02_FULL_50_16]OGQ67763.1 MAG: hypothetical protein A3F89_02015 [Deltaproteobacteria bacterium RIFCSPLOWO2_12_FULL_50_11]